MSENPTDPSSLDPHDELPVVAEVGTCLVPESQLAIRHLMVWAVCVALYLSAYHTLTLRHHDVRTEAGLIVLFGATALIYGAHLAVIPLMLSRWRRRLRFPRSGGEVLWIVGAVGVLQAFTVQLGHTLSEGSFLTFFMVRALAALLLWLPALVCAIRATHNYWRTYFVVLLAAGFAWYPFEQFANGLPGPFASVAIPGGCFLQFLLLAAVLSYVAWTDLRRTDAQFPWPHWIGIVIALVSKVIGVLACTYHLVTAILSWAST